MLAYLQQRAQAEPSRTAPEGPSGPDRRAAGIPLSWRKARGRRPGWILSLQPLERRLPAGVPLSIKQSGEPRGPAEVRYLPPRMSCRQWLEPADKVAIHWPRRRSSISYIMVHKRANVLNARSVCR